MESKYVWHEGKLVPFAAATVHVLTPALHYGFAVFEGIRVYANSKDVPCVFRLHEHIERLYRSAHILGFRTLPYSVEEVEKACVEVVAANGFKECYLRPLMYVKTGSWNLAADSGMLEVSIQAWEWKNYLGTKAMREGIRANVSSYTRLHPNVAMTCSKASGNYVNSLLAKTESVRAGFDEAIMLDAQGYVAECTGENLFVVRDKTVYTTPTAAILEGITRATVITLISKSLGLRLVEAPMARDQLYIADEVFVVGSAAEVVALREIDHRKIGDGKMGPVTAQVQHAYFECVRGKHSLAKKYAWLTPCAK